MWKEIYTGISELFRKTRTNPPESEVRIAFAGQYRVGVRYAENIVSLHPTYADTNGSISYQLMVKELPIDPYELSEELVQKLGMPVDDANILCHQTIGILHDVSGLPPERIVKTAEN